MTTAKLDYTLTISERQIGGLGTGHEREQQKNNHQNQQLNHNHDRLTLPKVKRIKR